MKPLEYYKDLRWSTLFTPKYRHLLLILGWVGYLIMFVLTEKLIPEERCHVVHSVVDDLIPFNETFILGYVSWYFFLVGSQLYFLFFDVETFKRALIFIIAAQVIGVLAFLFWPSVQYMRPDPYPRDNFCTDLVRLIQTADTPTGVCPSEHVGFSLALLSAWWWKKDSKIWVKLFMTAWALIVCVSVMFVKQHSFTDVWTAFVMCAVIEMVMDVVILRRKHSDKTKKRE